MLILAAGAFVAFKTLSSSSDSNDDAAPTPDSDNSEVPAEESELPADEPDDGPAPSDTNSEDLPVLTDQDLIDSLDQIRLGVWDVVDESSEFTNSTTGGICGGPNSHQRALDNQASGIADTLWNNNFNESYRIAVFRFPDADHSSRFIEETISATACGFYDDFVAEVEPGTETGPGLNVDWISGEEGFDWTRTTYFSPIDSSGFSGSSLIEIDSWWTLPGETLPSVGERYVLSLYQFEDVVVAHWLRGLCCFNGTDIPSFDSLPDVGQLNLLAEETSLVVAESLGRSGQRQ